MENIESVGVVIVWMGPVDLMWRFPIEYRASHLALALGIGS